MPSIPSGVNSFYNKFHNETTENVGVTMFSELISLTFKHIEFDQKLEDLAMNYFTFLKLNQNNEELKDIGLHHMLNAVGK